MKFLCDQMLTRLGRWLRAAGYDTAIVGESIADREVLEWACREGRILITRDHHFLKMKKAVNRLIWLNANELEGCIQDLIKKAPINWLKHAFSRCLVCNCLLVEADPLQLKGLPLDVLESRQRFLFCEHCQKVYWEGSHTQRMRQTLQRWQQQSLLVRRFTFD